MAIFKFGLGAVLGLVVAFGAAAQGNRPANDAPKPPMRDQTRDQANASDTKNPQARREERDPDRSTIGPRTTQGLAQDAITRSNSR